MAQKQQLNLMLGDYRLPFDIGALAGADAVGTARRRFPFGFIIQSIPFAAHFEEEGQTAHIDLTGEIGPMPFTAESAAARANLQAILDAANAQLGRVFRVSDGTIELVGRTSLEVPVTAVGLVSAIVGVLLPVKPYLDCINLILAPPCEERSRGESRLRPAWRRQPPRKTGGFTR